MFGVSYSAVDNVYYYIRNQKQHPFASEKLRESKTKNEHSKTNTSNSWNYMGLMMWNWMVNKWLKRLWNSHNPSHRCGIPPTHSFRSINNPAPREFHSRTTWWTICRIQQHWNRKSRRALQAIIERERRGNCPVEE